MRRLLTVAAEGRNTNLGTIEMNGTSTTRVVPGAHPLERRRASPVATRRSHGTTFVLFGDWTITAHRRSPSTPFPPPSAASKFLALLVALVALSTANAATLAGSAGGSPVHHSMLGDTARTEEALSTAISGTSYWESFLDRADLTSDDIQSHVRCLVRYYVQQPVHKLWRDDAVIKDLHRRCLGESRFQDLNPQNIPSRGTPASRPDLEPTTDSPNQFPSQDKSAHYPRVDDCPEGQRQG